MIDNASAKLLIGGESRAAVVAEVKARYQAILYGALPRTETDEGYRGFYPDLAALCGVSTRQFYRWLRTYPDLAAALHEVQQERKNTK